MTKYWNEPRIRRVRARQERREDRTVRRAIQERKRRPVYRAGEIQKNAMLILGALGKSLPRRMLARLRKEGAMSVSKLAEPFHLTLPSALAHVEALERAGIITTHKQGRVRLCVYNPTALKELARFLSLGDPKLD